ncbi:MAG: 23S rRNA (cytosine1962-C5)-methyltransferase [Parcubacteria group bacterium Gr01-1014_48]|nr:MAG: 23S rRNA (cytosine1962-C5)-methyltransferase [Parcubacteria group bacterium Greene0416_14]TSC73984.1 MAG: 23S rRNA (cytosine1962-C5)-methyltransferase [Parcubacteria group bacterium Gr01-1014_48]TSD00455.1 MAG: 23S rRNA (cytosine1962-C5)-methyltransferase [Parcubacteria group bacterium Greene1014_15]TSD07871.1 MAG: 23S rRNA (cytosine1962-C5)-methyltransferase [Parcubacteria group bacterium Greene0714_4]
MQHIISVKTYVPDRREYVLLDTGNKLKLEEVGTYRIIRSEPRAWWKPRLPKSVWDKAIAVYDKEDKKEWVFKKEIPKEFTLPFDGLMIKLQFLKSSKHIGIFPEQTDQWNFIRDCIRRQKEQEVRVLNLFGYTGIASLVAAQAGAQVTHVDGSKTTIAWARENQALSGLPKAPIRFILDDATDFVRREIKRGNRYDGIIMDPPSFGRGPKGQVWKAEEDLPQFLSACRGALSEKPLFFILNMYSTELSALSLGNLLMEATEDLDGSIETGELAIQEQNSDRVLPLSIFARWSM